MDDWSGHWHGYGPWTGPRSEHAKEDPRRPGKDLSRNDPKTQAFIAGSVPPVETGHALLRRPREGRTWTDLADALTWLEKNYRQHPPTGDLGLDLPDKLRYATDFLSKGSDAVWSYYTSGYVSYVSYEVICCPHRFHPTIPCPLPPPANT